MCYERVERVGELEDIFSGGVVWVCDWVVCASGGCVSDS